jgi:hypothetical protein
MVDTERQKAKVERQKRNIRSLSFYFLLLPFLYCLACQGESPNTSGTTGATGADLPTPYEGNEVPQISSLIESGSLKIGRIVALAEKLEAAEPFGEIVNLGIKNETGQAISFRVDCGTVLRAGDSKFQDLVVSRSAQGQIEPYAAWSGKLEVFSLQLERLYPVQPAEYCLGHISSGELRRFVECFCFNRPEADSGGGPLDLTPVQYAIWRVADNVTLNRVLDYTRRKGKPSAEEMAEAEQKAREQGRYAQQLLEDCRITAKFLD